MIVYVTNNKEPWTLNLEPWTILNTGISSRGSNKSTNAHKQYKLAMVLLQIKPKIAIEVKPYNHKLTQVLLHWP